MPSIKPWLLFRAVLRRAEAQRAALQWQGPAQEPFVKRSIGDDSNGKWD